MDRAAERNAWAHASAWCRRWCRPAADPGHRDRPVSSPASTWQDGVDLFGTYGNAIDYTAVSPRTIANVQIAAIVLGHVLGVLLAHDRAVRTGTHRATTGQLPLVVVMIAFTVGGLSLLLSS